MLLTGFPAGPPATNCWVLAPGPDAECLVIDPGIDAAAELDHVLESYHLHPVAVLLTHGHIDHTFSVVPVCAGHGIPAYISPADRGQLTDPYTALRMAQRIPLFGRDEFTEPSDVRALGDGDTVDLIDIALTVRATPGHTPGSVTFGTNGHLFSGDLIFAGSVGRTDLPGGSTDALLASIERTVLPLDDATVIHPGHGQETTVGAERARNPFLASMTGRMP